jgi:hypothetical protein
MTTSPFAPEYSSAPEKPLSPVEELWEAAREYIHTAYVMFGGPKVLAEKAWLSRKEYRHCLDWLFRCEELLRRLIFINALKFFALNLSKFGRPFPSASKYKPHAFDPDNPTRWRVSFELKYGAPASRRPARNLQNKAHAGEGAGAPYSNEPPNVVSALPLARRFEALRRAALQPMGPTMRLLRVMQRRKNTAHIARKYARPTQSYQRHNTKPGDFAIVDAIKIMADDVDIWRLKYAPDSS